MSEDLDICASWNHTCEHRRMGTVEDDEFCHHLWVVNGKQPRYGPTPVVADETTSVVSLEEKQMSVPENQYWSRCFIAGFLPQRTFTPIKWMYFMTCSQMQIKVRASVWGILITLLFQSLQTNPLTCASTVYTRWYESHRQASSQHWYHMRFKRDCHIAQSGSHFWKTTEGHGCFCCWSFSVAVSTDICYQNEKRAMLLAMRG